MYPINIMTEKLQGMGLCLPVFFNEFNVNSINEIFLLISTYLLRSLILYVYLTINNLNVVLLNNNNEIPDFLNDLNISF